MPGRPADASFVETYRSHGSLNEKSKCNRAKRTVHILFTLFHYRKPTVKGKGTEIDHATHLARDEKTSAINHITLFASPLQIVIDWHNSFLYELAVAKYRPFL
jgi:hypothetical protein